MEWELELECREVEGGQRTAPTDEWRETDRGIQNNYSRRESKRKTGPRGAKGVELPETCDSIESPVSSLQSDWRSSEHQHLWFALHFGYWP